MGGDFTAPSLEVLLTHPTPPSTSPDEVLLERFGTDIPRQLFVREYERGEDFFFEDRVGRGFELPKTQVRTIPTSVKKTEGPKRVLGSHIETVWEKGETEGPMSVMVKRHVTLFEIVRPKFRVEMMINDSLDPETSGRNSESKDRYVSSVTLVPVLVSSFTPK